MPACLSDHTSPVALSSTQWTASLQSKVTSRFSSWPLCFVLFLEQSHCFSPGRVSSDPTCTFSLWEISHLAYQLSDEGWCEPAVICWVAPCPLLSPFSSPGCPVLSATLLASPQALAVLVNGDHSGEQTQLGASVYLYTSCIMSWCPGGSGAWSIFKVPDKESFPHPTDTSGRKAAPGLLGPVISWCCIFFVFAV